MVSIPIRDVGTLGIVRDTAPESLPPEAWTDGRNIRFDDNKVTKFLGHQLVFDPPTVAPYWGMVVPTPTDLFWIYAGQDHVYVVDTVGTHTQITRAAGATIYTGALADLWQGSILGNIPVINNGIDDPQSWDPQTAATDLVDLPNWPANTSCKNIKAFKNFLVALDITLSGVRSPHKVKWSHPADPGTVPITWDETDPTKDAGETQLGSVSGGFLLDQLELGDINVIYKENSVHGMQFIGGRNIFRFYEIFQETGLLSARCVSSMAKGRRHFMATSDIDIIQHDGQNPQSLLDRRLKRWLQNNLDVDNFANSFTVPYISRREMWFCFPESGSTFPTKALVYNVDDNTMGIRDLADAAFIGQGVIDQTEDDTWDTGPAVNWNDDNRTWGERIYGAFKPQLMQFDPTNTKLFQLDQTGQFNGTSFTTFIQRSALGVVGQDRRGNPIVDHESIKLCHRVWPQVIGGPITVRVGSQDAPSGIIAWSTTLTFDPATEEFVDFMDSVKPGRYFAVEFGSTGSAAWDLLGYNVEIEVIGGL